MVVGVCDGVGLKPATSVMTRAVAVRPKSGVDVSGGGVGDGAGSEGLHADAASTIMIAINRKILGWVCKGSNQADYWVTLISMDTRQNRMFPKYSPQVSS